MAYFDKDYWSVTDPRTWSGGGGWRAGAPHDTANRDADRGIRPENKALLQAINPVTMASTAIDRVRGARAARGVVAGRPRELLSVIPGSDSFGLTRPQDERDSHFGLVGDMLINPGTARMGAAGIGAAGKAVLGRLRAPALPAAPGPPPSLMPQLGPPRPRPTPAPAAALTPRGTSDFGPFANRRPMIPPGPDALGRRMVADEVKRAIPGATGSGTVGGVVGETADRMAAPPVPSANLTDLMRRGSRMYKERPLAPGLPAWRGVGGRAQIRTEGHRRMAVKEAVDLRDEADASGGILRGYAQPGQSWRPGYAVAYAPDPRDGLAKFGETVRHERVHALMQEAARRGPTGVRQLPPLFRVPTEMRQSDRAMNRAVGMLADEGVAQALGKRGVRDQFLQGAGFFLDAGHPGRSHYAMQAAAISPLVGHAYQSLPAAWDATRAGATGAAIAAPLATLNAVRSGRYEPDRGEF
jgi:hypothetical protein